MKGFYAFAPELALASDSGFSFHEFRMLASTEEKNFWFRGRNKLIVWVMGQYCSQAATFCEIGCGTGFVLRGIAEAFPQLALSGSEISVAGLTYAKERNPSANLFQMDATKIPFEAEFDCIGAFDVLEHIENDQLAISEMFKALKPGGKGIVSVPQHMNLFSEQDRTAGHFRRYGSHELQAKMEAAGFQIELKTSFVSILLPALYAARKLGSTRGEEEPPPELSLPGPLNAIFESTLDFELLLFRLGVRLPVGGSQLLVAQRPS